ncbi:MAG: efflux RND transporter periplasmic adaptor subunit [Candidatus Pacebacteria bacterium]|nr:efflux RND transporter periplasmic adaptor subunit [Candidatus Paceibacterota bacterium]
MKKTNKKIIFGAIVIILVVGGYFGYKAFKGGSNVTKYVLSPVTKGTIVVSVEGTGQVLSLDQVDVKPKASGEIVFLGLTEGALVSKGALLAKIDTTSLEKEIANDQASLQQAQLDLDKMNGTTTPEGVLRGVKEKAQDNLNSTYDSGFNTVSNIFLNLPSTMSGLSNILFSYDFNSGQWNIDYYNDMIRAYDYEADIYRTDAYNKYQTARAAYDQNLKDYKLVSRSSDDPTIEALISETYQTIEDISEAIKSSNDLIQFYQDKLTSRNLKPQTLSNTHLSNLSSYTSQTNGYISSLSSLIDSISSDKEALINTSYDIQDQETKVQTAKDTLQDAKDKLADYYVYAPFSGIITNVNVEKGDTVSSGTTLATLITKQKIAEVSLNEVDASNVKVGQKATLTFYAIDGLSITGSVFDVSSLGSVSQGVVSYTAKISFDTQDDRIKPSMSVTASIVVDVKQDVLTIPNSALKLSGDVSYVEMLTASDILGNTSSNTGVSSKTPPVQQQIEVGLSNDSVTEVVNGLKEGDQVITRTIAPTTATTQAQGQSLLQTAGGRATGGAGAVRIQTGGGNFGR